MEPFGETPRALRLRRLLEIAREVLSNPEPEPIYARILEAARELTGARYAALGVLNEQRTGLERLRTAGIDDAAHRAIGDLPGGRGVLGLLVSDPRPLRIDELSRHEASYGFPPGHPVMETFLGVPVRVRGEICGNLYVAEKDGGFDDSDEEIAIVVADWAATTIELERSRRSGGRRWRDRERAREREHEHDAPSEPAGAAGESAARGTLLLVEDEPALQALIATVLEEQGYTVLAAGNGLDAIAIGERHEGRIDLLLTDVVLPGLSGPELAGRMVELRPGLEVLHMSGYNDSRLLSRGAEHLNANLLVKPFTPDQLIARVRVLMAQQPR
jgi:CheY-like chemotaxis protein